MGHEARRTLRQVGWALLVVGVLDIGAMAYCLANHISYQSSFNIFAVIAGALLLRGSLRTAGIVRGMGAFMLTMVAAGAIFVVVQQPPGLLLARARQGGAAAVALAVGLPLALAGFLAWVVRALGSAPVRAARLAVQQHTCALRWPVGFGAAGAVAMGIAVAISINSAAARQAEALAAARLGPAYQYQINTLNIAWKNGKSHVTAVVTAWRGDDIREVTLNFDTAE